MAFRFLHNTFQALVDFGIAIDDATFGRRRRDARNAQMTHPDDIEMDMITALNASPNFNHNNHRPMPEFSLVREFINGIRFTGLRRSTALNEARDVTFMAAILAIIAFLVFLGVAVGRPLAWLFGPVGMTSRDLGAHNWHKTDNISAIWSAQYNQSLAISHADPIYVPGFYFYSPQDDTSNSIWQTSPVVSATSTVPSAYEAITTVTQELLAVEQHMIERHSADAYGPFHHTYPLHVRSIDHSEHTSKIRDQLLDCVNVLSHRLEEQGLEISPRFESMLQHCSSTIDHALNTLYPLAVSENNISTDVMNKRFTDVRLATDGVIDQNRTNVECEWKRPISRLTGRSCSKDFCDWVAIAKLDRCYHTNKTRFQQDGTKIYLNESIDDFKDDAPLECNLCLPRQDCDGIDEHCNGVEDTQNAVLVDLLIIVAGLALTSSVVACVMIKRRRRRQEREVAGVPQNVESLELRDRVPVMPRA